METKTENSEIQFNLTKALIVIERDEDLNDMFRSKYGTDYKMCHALINSGTGLKKEAEAYIKALFEGVILEKKVLRNKFLSLGDEPKVEVVPIAEPKVEAKPIAEPKVEVKEEAPKKERKVVDKMRWGIKAIAKDIVDNFNGESKQIHRTGKMVQELKKVFIRLEQRTWKERYKTETLTDDQLRQISGAVETFNKKIESIINPKK